MAPMRYLSVCSGIEGASVAWRNLGWETAGFAEIDPFACALLAHRFPGVPNFGDFTQIGPEHVGAVDLLVGGTPCQDFSVAGLRAGLAGDRGRLTVEFVRLLDRSSAGGGLGTDFDLDGGLVVGTLSASGAGVTRTGNARSECDMLIAYAPSVHGSFVESPIAGPLRANAGGASGGTETVVAFMTQQEPKCSEDGTAFTLTADSPTGGGQHQCVATGQRVRRVTPRECERLQGFPDDWTVVPYRGRPAADGPRCRALGNSFAVPVVRWLGDRVALVENLLSE